MNTRFLSILVLSALLVAPLMTGCASRSVSPAPVTASDVAQAFDVTVATLTTAFVPNPGLGDTSLLFRTLGAGGMVYFGLQELLFPLPSPSQASPLARAFARPDEKPPSPSAEAAPPAMLRMRFEAASSTVQVVGEKQLSGIVNYFIGNDPALWRAAIPTYGEVAYRGLYPGIDLVYGADKGALKGTYVVAPGADPGLIRWRYEGASEVQLRDGELHIHIAEADGPPLLIEHRPVAWQTVAGQQKPVAVSYEQRRDGTFGFAVGRYDPSQPLIIDPTLDYGTYWGNLGCEGAYHVTTDAANNVYVVGATNVAAFPAQTTDCQAEDYYDLFVMKLDPSQPGANQRIYTTYLGGNKLDLADAVYVDATGNVYVGGYSWSDNFPTTTNAYQRTFGGGLADALALRLNAQGTPTYASYVGGSDFEEAFDMTVSQGLIHLVGSTSSSNFPTTANAYQRTYRNNDGFIAVIDPAQSGAGSLVYATLFGGGNSEEIDAIAVANGLIYFAGVTASSDLPLQNPIYATISTDMSDIFAAILDRAQTGEAQLRFSTFLGGNDQEMPGGVAVDAAGRMHLTGYTKSSNFPHTAVSPAHGGLLDGFVAKLDPVTPALLFSRFVGGSGRDGLRDILLDSTGNIYVAGGSGSANLSLVSPIQAEYKGGAAKADEPYGWLGEGDALVAKFAPDGAMLFGTYLGGTGFDMAMGISLAANGKVYVAGGTNSTNFSTTANAHQGTNAGKFDAFVVALGGLAAGKVTKFVYLPLVLRW